MLFRSYHFGDHLLRIYSSDPEVIRYGLTRMQLICQVYFLCGMMDVTVGILRGMGYAIMPMIMSLAGACGLRVLWIFTIFHWNHSLFVLFNWRAKMAAQEAMQLPIAINCCIESKSAALESHVNNSAYHS